MPPLRLTKTGGGADRQQAYDRRELTKHLGSMRDEYSSEEEMISRMEAESIAKRVTPHVVDLGDGAYGQGNRPLVRQETV